jgi:integrase
MLDRCARCVQHELPLSKQALSIIERRRALRLQSQDKGEFVWGRRWTKWSDGKAQLDRRLDLDDWRLHDLRRTAATIMAELAVLPHRGNPQSRQRSQVRRSRNL